MREEATDTGLRTASFCRKGNAEERTETGKKGKKQDGEGRATKGWKSNEGFEQHEGN